MKERLLNEQPLLYVVIIADIEIKKDDLFSERLDTVLYLKRIISDYVKN